MRLWDAANGDCVQVLGGHADEAFSCAFSYQGDRVVTVAKDNTYRIWEF